MGNRKQYIALFDLDKTILSINSGTALVKEAFNRGSLGNSGLINAIYLSFLYKLDLRPTSAIITGMAKWLNGITLDELSSLTMSVVDKYLIGAIRPGIVHEIKHHRDNNAELVILSSAIFEICDPICSQLGMDRSICTEMEITNGILTGNPIGTFCFEEEKRIRMVEYCKERNYKLNEAYYYGDSISDLPALETVGNPVCVAPDRRLRAIAKSRKWRICRSKKNSSFAYPA